MRIGIDARMYSPQFTGIGRYVYELTRHLFEIDSTNEYVLFMNQPQYTAFRPPHSRIKKILVNAKHYSLAEQLRFCRLLYREHLDLMHFTHFNAPILYCRPSVVTIHDLTLSFFPGKKMTQWHHRLAYNTVIRSSVHHARHIIAVSENTKKDLVHLLGVNSKKISVIYEGVAEEFKRLKPSDPSLKQLHEDYSLKHGFILYTGVWRNHKNLVNLIRAFGLLCKNPSFKGKLVITGKEDPFYPEVKFTLAALGLQKRVLLTGLVSEKMLIALYNAATVYCLPSLYEGFGLSPLEAMACGTPVVASQTSCIPEVCGQDNAIFFDPKSPQAIANALQNIWDDPEIQKRLIENGLRHVKRFSWRAMAETTKKVYEGIDGKT